MRLLVPGLNCCGHKPAAVYIDMQRCAGIVNWRLQHAMYAVNACKSMSTEIRYLVIRLAPKHRNLQPLKQEPSGPVPGGEVPLLVCQPVRRSCVLCREGNQGCARGCRGRLSSGEAASPLRIALVLHLHQLCGRECVHVACHIELHTSPHNNFLHSQLPCNSGVEQVNVVKAFTWRDIAH